MPDVNTYSLNLLLDVASNAPVVLDDVSDRLDKINEQIAQIGGAFSSALGGAAESVAEATDQIASSMDEVNQSLNQSWPIMEDMEELRQQAKDDLEEILDANEQVEESQGRQGDWWEQILDPVGQIRDGVGGIAADAGDVNDQMNTLGGNVAKAARGFWDMFLGIEAIKHAFAEFLELQEDFVIASYRLYGAQEQIVQQVSEISDEYELLRGTAHEAMKSLGISLRVPRDELAKYVAQVTMFNRITGASIEIASEWIRKMTLAGFTSRDTERSLHRMTLMMRTAGFTTEEINKMLSKEIDQSAQLWFAFGTKGMAAIQNVKRELLALTRAHHGDTEALQSLLDASTSNLATMGLLTDHAQKYRAELAGVAAHERAGAELKWGLFDVIMELRKEYGDLSGVTREHLVDMADSSAALKAYGGLFASHGDEIAKVAQSWNEFETPEEFQRALEEVSASIGDLDTFAEAMDTVKAAWETALRPLFNAWIHLMVALAPVMKFVISLVGMLVDVLAFLINTIAAIIDPIAAFDRHLKSTAESGEEVVGFFKRMGEGVLNLGKALPGLIFGVAALVGLYYGLRLVSNLFINWVNRMRPANLMAIATAFLAMGAATLMVATSLAIIASLGWKAAGALVILTAAMAAMALTITFLATVARSSTVPLSALAGVMLAFGAASLMIAGSVWIVTDAMKSMADMGWKLVGALVGVAAVVGIFTAALVVLGYAATPAAPAILAIGAAFLMMGAAVWLAAKAFEVVVNSFAELGASAMQVVSNAGALFAAVGIISAALLTLAVVGAITAIPLLALGAALLVVGAAAVMIARSFEAAAEVIKAFADIKNVENAISGMEYAIISLMFTMAGISIVLAPVLPLMAVAAVVLLAVGAAAWLTAKAMDVMASSLEKFGDLDMITAALTGLSVALAGLAGIALLISPALPAMIMMGVAMLSVGAGAWMLSKALGAVIVAIQDFADLRTEEISLAGRNLADFGVVLGGAAVAVFAGAVLMAPAAIALGIAMSALAVALWLVPVDRLNEIGPAFGMAGRGVRSFVADLRALADLDIGELVAKSREISSAFDALGRDVREAIGIRADQGLVVSEAIAALSSSMDQIDAIAARGDSLGGLASTMGIALDQIDAIAARGDSFGELASTISAALDEIESQAARADAVADSFARLNEAIIGALSGPPEPVYGGVAEALRDRMDLIEEQVARAEAIYAPIEGIAEQAELASAMAGEPAPEGLAEPVGGALGPAGGEEDFMATSNFIQLRKQTDLLEKIEAAMPPEEIAKAADKIVGAVGEIADRMANSWLFGGSEKEDGAAAEG